LLFNSLIFTVFLPLVFGCYWLTPARYRNYLLLFASYYFYYSYNPWFLLLLIGTSAFDYWCARQIETHPARKKIFLVLSLFSNLGVLFAFKYFVFFYNTAQQALHLPYSVLHELIIPAGLSFYTFQSISYTIDVYRGKYKPNDTLFDFLLFVSFFPHMVAGPVVRYNSLMPQLKAHSYLRQVDWKSAASLIIWGYFKKLVIADNLNLVVSPVFDQVSAFSGLELLLAGFLFVVQVYCDFSGYSDIATGAAKLFNIHLSLNWRRPLLSRSLHEFWQRNHISITTWFRDYLYIGLGGNRVNYSRWLLNIFLVFVISGFWHGASFTFIVWGCLHGLFFIAETLLRKAFPTVKVPALIGWLYLITFHTLSLIAFRANSVADLELIYRKIFSFGPGYRSLQHLDFQDRFFYAVMLVMIGLLALKELNEEFAWLNRYPTAYKALRGMAYTGMILLIFILGNFSANTFIYFQF
jgi:alginate O-acetyltransferase complex protein AlgI